MHRWVLHIDVITAASNILLKIFALDDYGTNSVSFWKFWPKSSAHNQQKYQILPSIYMLFKVDPNLVQSAFDMNVPIFHLVGNEGAASMSLICNLPKVKQAIEDYEQQRQAKKGTVDAMDTEI